MAITFNKKSWKSRISEHPTRRRLTIVDASLGYSLVDVARDEGTVEQVGDTFDKSTMDDLENRIENIAITAQAECDAIQAEIDEMPSLNDVKEVDVGWKESGTRNVAGDTIKVNPFELFSGTVQTKTGKNLFDKDDASIQLQGFLTVSSNTYRTSTGDIMTICLPVEPSTTYTVSKVSSTRFAIASCPSIPTNNSLVNNYTVNNTGTYLTLTTSSTDYYLLAYVYNGEYDTMTASEILATVQIEKGSTATAYEPYTESIVINGFIPSAKFFQMGRAFMQEKPVKEFREELNPYYEGALLTVTKDRFYSLEYVDINRVSDIQTMYGYDYTNERFLESVAGEIYTASGSISCDLQVTDIWGCGGNGASYYHSDTTVPVDLTNRNTTSANGFPIELMPVNQSDVASLVVGSPVSFRITGELYILLNNGVSLREYVEGMHVSKFYTFVPWTDTRDGVHYAKHFIDIEKGTTFNLSSITTLINYHFLQAYVDDPDMLDFISWTVTDSNIAITGDDYASSIVLHIDQRKDGETEPDLDTAEDIIINVI